MENKPLALNRIGIYLNRNKGYSVETAQHCIQLLTARGSAVIVPEDQVEDIVLQGAEVVEEAVFFQVADLILTLGGDGTLLRVARKAALNDVPVCGINLGKLGFLTDSSLEDVEPLIDLICSGEVQLEERMMLSCQVLSAAGKPVSYLALNDIVVKSTDMRMIEIRAVADKEVVDDFRADGVIVATPTGSTAYSLAAGGPVVMPGAEVMLINPICPHRLHDRTYVIAPEKTITLRIMEGAGEVCIDGQIRRVVSADDLITIRRATQKVKILRPKDFSFFERLRHKLTKEI